MRVQPASRRNWTVVPLLLGITAVMALSTNASVMKVSAQDAKTRSEVVLVKCPARLAAVDALTPLALLSPEARVTDLGLLGPLAGVPEEVDEMLTPQPKQSKRKPKHKPNKPTPRPKAHPRPKPKPKPKPKPDTNYSQMTTTSKHKPTHPNPHTTRTNSRDTHPPNRPNPVGTTATTTSTAPAPSGIATSASTNRPAHPVAPTHGHVTLTEVTPHSGPPATMATTATATNTTVVYVPMPVIAPSGGVSPGAITHGTPTQSITPLRPHSTSVITTPIPTSTRTTARATTTTTTTVTTTATATATAITTTTTTTTIAAVTTMTTTTTTTATRTTTTATASSSVPMTTSHHSRSHKPTTTPWLPSTIVPIAPSQTVAPPSPGTSLPDVVIPDLHPDIPSESMNVMMRFEQVSYAQVISNGVLAAQLVSFLPAQLSKVLNVDQDLVLVLAIRDGSSSSSSSSSSLASLSSTDNEFGSGLGTGAIAKDGKDVVRDGGSKKVGKRGLVTTNNVADAILVTVAIPKTQYWPLSTLVQDKASVLYVPGADSFGQYLDHTYPLSPHPPSQDGNGSNDGGDGTGGDNNGGGNGDGSTADPLTEALPDTAKSNNNNNGEGGASHGAIIGSIVGLTTAAYVGLAMVVMKKYRAKKVKQAEREALQRSISAPILQESHHQGWGWHS
ncbi:hypothetical protein EDD11_008369 [Mortierella claussenii]|nr:hypothetical protein EDD11_008369 [Mortierella claussenii]